MHAAIGANTIGDVEWFGTLREEPEPRPYLGGNETEIQSGRTHQDSRAWATVGKNQFPFLRERLGCVVRQPVLMIEQDKMGVDAGVLLEEL
jgi:hypothetical protein